MPPVAKYARLRFPGYGGLVPVPQGQGTNATKTCEHQNAQQPGRQGRGPQESP